MSKVTYNDCVKHGSYVGTFVTAPCNESKSKPRSQVKQRLNAFSKQEDEDVVRNMWMTTNQRDFRGSGHAASQGLNIK